MRNLLDELAAPPRRWPIVVAGSTLVLGFGIGLGVHLDEDPCASSTTERDAVWSEADRDAVRAAFARTGHPEAEELLGRVERQLDGYATEWSEMHTESCHATFVTRRQTEQLHGRRVHCLERRRNRMRSAIDALGQVETPTQAVDRTLLPFLLPRLADCADVEAMSATLPLPDDPELRRSVLALRRTIDEAQSAKDAGDLTHGLELARSAVELARQTRFPPVVGEALECLGSLQVQGGSAREAQATLETAILEASTAGDLATTARSWTWLIYALTQQGRYDEGKSLELAARAAVEQANDDTTRGWLLNNLGVLHNDAGSFERSHELMRQAIELKRRALGEDHVDVGISWFNLGSALIEQARYAEASEALGRAQSIFDATVGPSHGLSQVVLLGECRIEHERGQHEAAIELCGRALEHFAISPVSHVLMGRTYLLMAKALRGAGRPEDAEDHARRGLDLVRADNPALATEIEDWLRTMGSRGRR